MYHCGWHLIPTTWLDDFCWVSGSLDPAWHVLFWCTYKEARIKCVCREN